MPRNGTGTYVPPTGQPVVPGTTISSTTFNALVVDLGVELTKSVCTDGQAPMIAPLQMGGNKITGLSAGVAVGDAIRLDQLTSGLAPYLTSAAAAAAYLPLAGGAMTGQILIKEGTASVPGLSFVNDGAPDTGLYHISDGSFGITCNTVSVVVFNTGGVTVTGTMAATVVTQTSDERKKENWRALTDAQLDALANMQKAGLFDWIDGGESSCGGSAQEIRAIVPQAVHEGADGSLTVNYGGLCFVIAQATLRRLWGAK